MNGSGIDLLYTELLAWSNVVEWIFWNLHSYVDFLIEVIRGIMFEIVHASYGRHGLLIEK